MLGPCATQVQCWTRCWTHHNFSEVLSVKNRTFGNFIGERHVEM
jgi:hypothetical protein